MQVGIGLVEFRGPLEVLLRLTVNQGVDRTGDLKLAAKVIRKKGRPTNGDRGQK
jgi:hypothetical protein